MVEDRFQFPSILPGYFILRCLNRRNRRTTGLSPADQGLGCGVMTSVQTVSLTRDCDGVQIPVGNVVTLPAGTDVDITQTLGGSYTVHALGGLFRINPLTGTATPIANPTSRLS